MNYMNNLYQHVENSDWLAGESVYLTTTTPTTHTLPFANWINLVILTQKVYKIDQHNFLYSHNRK